MNRILGALATLCRQWKYVEEDPAAASVVIPPAESERIRTRRAIERAEQLLTDYRRSGCVGLARDCETNLHSLRIHLAALEF